ncbi:MAG: isoprenyl transferase [Chitinophagales bacterium]|nr:isoprenyl transferase [Chitinophagales bacterium]
MITNDIDKSKLPQHIAIIMDGNGRWAQSQGKDRTFGHQNGVESVREAIKGCMEIGVKYLTLYAFSTENWNRPKEEVDFLMNLLVEAIVGETPELLKNDIRLETIGAIDELPHVSYQHLLQAKKDTAHCKELTLILALNYGSKKEITQAVQSIANRVLKGDLKIENIDETCITDNLYTCSFPDPEIMIRTSNEMRVSNFLTWQLAYAEFFFLPIFWPEFKREHLWECVRDFQQRERRFGKTSAQVQ